MKILRIVSLGFVMAVLMQGEGLFAGESADLTSPVGYWETISDVNHKPRSVMYLFEKDGVLYGKAVKSLVPGDTLERPCEKCPDEFHNQTIAGMQVIWGLKEKNGEWKGGKLLDADSGNIYRCKLSVTEDGQHLKVRGFIGISLLGRTQTWNRLPNYQ